MNTTSASDLPVRNVHRTFKERWLFLFPACRPSKKTT